MNVEKGEYNWLIKPGCSKGGKEISTEDLFFKNLLVIDQVFDPFSKLILYFDTNIFSSFNQFHSQSLDLLTNPFRNRGSGTKKNSTINIENNSFHGSISNLNYT